MKNKNLKEELFFSMTWDYLNIYLTSQHRDSKKTIKSYEDGLTIFRRYLTDYLSLSMENFYFKDLTYDFLLDYREYLLKKYKERTVNHRLAVIISYVKYAASKRTSLYQIYLNISEVPYVTVPVKIRDIIEDKNAIKALLSAPKPSLKGIRDQIILVLLYDTAIRVNELISLNYNDVNISADKPYLRIHGKGDKERIVAISDKVIPLVKQYISLYHNNLNKSEIVIPFIYTLIKGNIGRMTERNIERIVQKYADIIRKDYPNIPKHVYPHMLRRTRASGWYRDGVPLETIAVILGHSDAKTTRKSYASPSVDMLRQYMSAGTEAEPNNTTEKPLWNGDAELAKLCGIR